jgi:hypothetical protein
MTKQMTMNGSVPSYFDGPTMIHFQFPSRIVEDVWCRDDYDENDITYCRGHGYDPDIVNVPLSSFVVGSSLVANGGRGVFTTRQIQKGSYIFVDDCVSGIIVPITTLELLYTAAKRMTNVSEFWELVSDGFMDGYGWTDSFLVRDGHNYSSFAFSRISYFCLIHCFRMYREDHIWEVWIQALLRLSITAVVPRTTLARNWPIMK